MTYAKYVIESFAKLLREERMETIFYDFNYGGYPECNYFTPTHISKELSIYSIREYGYMFYEFRYNNCREVLVNYDNYEQSEVEDMVDFIFGLYDKPNKDVKNEDYDYYTNMYNELIVLNYQMSTNEHFNSMLDVKYTHFR